MLRRRTLFDRGYVWALHQYIRGMSGIEIESYISISHCTDFDYGIKFFLNRYQLEVV